MNLRSAVTYRERLIFFVQYASKHVFCIFTFLKFINERQGSRWLCQFKENGTSGVSETYKFYFALLITVFIGLATVGWNCMHKAGVRMKI